MATKKASTTYSISARLKIDVSREIVASSLEEAVAKAKELTINDFIDFTAQDLDHNDSEAPDVYSIYRV